MGLPGVSLPLRLAVPTLPSPSVPPPTLPWGGPCRDRALLELHGQEQSPVGCHGLRAAETCWWHRGWQLGSEELLTQTFPSHVHGPKVGVGPVCASGWTSHHGYWGLFTSINYFFILKRHLERDRASRGTDTIKALRKQDPVSQPGCGTVAMPQQGMLMGGGVLQSQPVPRWWPSQGQLPAGPWGPAQPQGLCDGLRFPPAGAKHNLPLMPRYLWHRDVGRKPTGVSKPWTVSKVRAVFDGGEYALEN